MSRIIQFLIFITMFCIVYFSLHFFVYIRITNGLDLPARYITYLKYTFIFSACSIFIGRFFDNVFGIQIVKTYSYYWLGLISIAFAVFMIGFLIKSLYPIHTTLLTVFLICLTVLITGFSIINQAKRPKIKQIEICSKKLPGDLKQFTIVQLSDLHIGNSTGEKWLNWVVDTSNSLEPDLIVLTGDVFEEKLRQGKEIFKILSRLESSHGVVGVTGNHEFFLGIKLSEEYFIKSGIRLLRNVKLHLTDQIDIYGIDDNIGKAFEKGVGPKNIFDNVNKNKINILLFHRPEKFSQAVAKGIDLQLSGHTHQGQIPPLDLIVRLVFRYSYGLHQVGSSYIYTTSGTGIWGPPMRFMNSSEIVKIVVKPG